jgi:hypothetical protein
LAGKSTFVVHLRSLGRSISSIVDLRCMLEMIVHAGFRTSSIAYRRRTKRRVYSIAHMRCTWSTVRARFRISSIAYRRRTKRRVYSMAHVRSTWLIAHAPFRIASIADTRCDDCRNYSMVHLR